MFKQFTKECIFPVSILQSTRISSTEFYERIEHHSPEKLIQYLKLELPPLLQLSLENFRVFLFPEFGNCCNEWIREEGVSLRHEFFMMPVFSKSLVQWQVKMLPQSLLMQEACLFIDSRTSWFFHREVSKEITVKADFILGCYNGEEFPDIFYRSGRSTLCHEVRPAGTLQC